MPKPVYLLIVQEAHKEYNSLVNQIWVKYGQIDSGEVGTVSTPAFIAETCKLANLFTHMSQLCAKLNLPIPNELHRPTLLKH